MKIQSPKYSEMGYSGQIFHFNAYSTRIPHAAFFARKKGAKTYDLISEIHNKKVPILRRNYCKTKKDGISLRIFRRGPSVEIRTQGLLNPIVACFSFPVQRLQNLDNTDFWGRFLSSKIASFFKYFLPFPTYSTWVPNTAFLNIHFQSRFIPKSR